MKTWEIWEQMDKNPDKMMGKNFRRTNTPVIAQASRSINGIMGLFVEDVRLTDLTGFEEWEEVEEPVSFMEAVGALDKGKTIYALHGENYKYKEVFSPALNKVDGGIALYQDQHHTIWTGLILYGKWYIKD